MAEPVIDQLTEFCAARFTALLGQAPRAFRDRSSLAEDWWVEDKLALGLSFPLPKLCQEDGLRACYRWARDRAPFGNAAGEADLLLHQAAELIPAMFAAAAQNGLPGA